MNRVANVVKPATLVSLLLLLLFAPVAEAGKKKAAAAAPSMSENPQALFQLGSKYFTDGLLTEARATLEKAVRLGGSYAEAEYLLGLVCFAQKDWEGAVRSLQSALKSNPFFTEAHNALGITYAEMGDLDRALTEFRIVLSDQQYPTPEVANYNIGRIYLRKGRNETALAYFKRACDENPKFGRACLEYGMALEESGRLREARDAYERAVGNVPEDIPESWQVHYRLGLVCYDLKDEVCAREQLRRTLDSAPPDDVDRKVRELLERLDGAGAGVRILRDGEPR